MSNSAAQSRREERAQAQRERILCAAEQCFIEHGFHAASMAGIAEAAQMSAGLIYRYFESKSAIILAIIERQLEEKRADIAALDDGCELASRVQALFSAWQQGERGVTSAPLFLEMSAEASRDERIANALRRSDELTRAEFSDWLRQRKRQSGGGESLTEEELAWRSFTLQCFIEGLAIRALHEPQLDGEVLVRSLERVLPLLLME
ncbi:MAG: TetR/AcrR family transcriptional regulator [Pseudomonadota bacterium]